MRFYWCLLLVPALGGCVANDQYQAPVAYAPAYAAPSCGSYTPPAPSACSAPYRASSPNYASPAAYTPQTQEPPR